MRRQQHTAELPADTDEWPSADPELCGRVEDRLARELGLEPHELFLDFPAKSGMLALDLPLVRRDGTVIHLAGREAAEFLDLPRVAAELYRSERRLRVFVLRPVSVPARAIVELVMTPGAEVAARIAADRGLLRTGPG
jgi:hypothetical protein